MPGQDRLAPYALGLRPGAAIAGEPTEFLGSVLSVEMTGFWPSANTIAGFAPATGNAVLARGTDGSGLVALSTTASGVRGYSTNGWGGDFSSDEGYGLRVDSNGADHFDHGAYVTAERGYGLLAQSAENMAIRGEAGDVSAFSPPLGRVGVAGLGQARGVSGHSADGLGVYGVSDASYGVWGQSSDGFGVTGRTSRVDDNYGLYTPDNLFAKNYNLTGAVMQVMQNADGAPLEPGDVVAFSGISETTVNAASALENVPIIQVRRADAANGQAVAGWSSAGLISPQSLLMKRLKTMRARMQRRRPGSHRAIFCWWWSTARFGSRRPSSPERSGRAIP